MGRRLGSGRRWVQFALVVALATLAAAVGLPGLALPASARPSASTYDASTYVYDAPALLSSQSAAAPYVRGSPPGPRLASWGRSASARGCCVAANTADDLAGIVYRRTDLMGGKPYIGQAKSESRFITRQAEHARANPDADFEFEIIGRAEPGVELDRLEEYFIRQGGGPTNISHPDGGLANWRHQMSDLRYGQAGGDPW